MKRFVLFVYSYVFLVIVCCGNMDFVISMWWKNNVKKNLRWLIFYVNGLMMSLLYYNKLVRI